MMQYTNDQDLVSLDRVENPMFLMNKATIGLAKFGCGRARVGMIPQQGKSPVEAAHIGFANFLAELRKAEFVNLAQVRYSRTGKSDVSHASPAVWR